LCHVQSFCGTAEVEFFGHGDEVTQVSQFHVVRAGVGLSLAFPPT
jgi:hypothetical protein